ncbi:high mobility group box domain-containing protein [Absidia repens]|uniref:High mobility group box domain-containing protein n=1 Tax=Absidia repens TaxID=90262 RepID=A0A1X2ISS7_9FUNG|nr:high mobility group box domain-containing protein [Absidia repens]
MRTSKSNTRKSTKSKVPRPINCFLAFRLDKYPIIAAQSPKLNHRDISKVIAKWWKEASEEEKKPYIEIALKKKAEHKSLHPNYKYEPIKKSDRHVRPYIRKEDATVLRRKAQANKELLKHWLGDDELQSDNDKDLPNDTSSCNLSQSPCSISSSVDSLSPQTSPLSVLFKNDFCFPTLPLNSDNHPNLYNPLFDFDPSYNVSQPLALDSWMDIDPSFLSTANLPFFDYDNYIDLQTLSL